MPSAMTEDQFFEELFGPVPELLDLIPSPSIKYEEDAFEISWIVGAVDCESYAIYVNDDTTIDIIEQDGHGKWRPISDVEIDTVRDRLVELFG
jgi:hypothetical protein